jgi:flagellar basal-body rod modification protein FlgD
MAVETDTSASPAVQVVGTLSRVNVSAGGAVMLTMSNVGEISPSAITAFNGVPASTTPH